MKEQQIVLGGGCFWCLDAIYRRVKGVTEVVSGYAGGESQPEKGLFSADYNNNAEVVRLIYNSSVINFEKILEIFWHVHDPTSLNRQNYDVGPQYRSIILYSSEKQKQIAEKSLKDVGQPLWDDPIVTEIKPLDKFYPAEDYHQDYFNKNPQAGYCQVIINPKLAKFNKEFSNLLKT